MTNIFAVFYKQIIDTLKNKTVLIQFLMFPVMTFIMNKTVKIDNLPENFFIELFAVMFVGMAPLVSSAAIVSEEKENGTLKALCMAGVKPSEYIFGLGSYVCIACLVGSVVISFSGDYSLAQVVAFLLVMLIGIFISLVLGVCVGIISHSQMGATSLSVPIMMVFSFLPMLSMFNDNIKQIAKYTYTFQLQNLLSNIGLSDGLGKILHTTPIESFLILAINITIVLVVFIVGYKKNRLD